MVTEKREEEMRGELRKEEMSAEGERESTKKR